MHNYKHHNTVKCLIGISPQDVFPFTSEGWGSQVSDQYLTGNCGILENLLPGDQMLTDSGFNANKPVGFTAKVVILLLRGRNESTHRV